MSRLRHFLKLGLLLVFSYTFSVHAQLNEIEGPPINYPDVPIGFYAAEAISIAVNAGIIIGREDGTFDGDAALNRYEAAIIAARLMGAVPKRHKIIFIRIHNF